jgi:lipopolysaccharide transport system permease protein
MRLSFPQALWRHRELLSALVVRDVAGRYQGSLLGWGWSLLTPLLMLAVYTFVFSQIFRARWEDLATQGSLGFAINIFSGLIVFNIFSECANRAPALILENTSYVKKVVFPLEVLGAATVGAATFHAFTSLLVLAVFRLIATHGLPHTFLWIPLVWLPLLLGSLALTWVLSALGVFLRDIGQLVGILVSMLMFLSAVFYPVSALPERWQPLLMLNPLITVIEQTRRVAVIGQSPAWTYLLVGSLLGVVAAELAYRSFRKARRGFSDVL